MSIIARDDNGNVVDAYTPSTSQVLAAGNTTAQSAAFATGVTLVRVSVASGHCYVAFGANPTATITTSAMIPANTVAFFKVTSGNKMAYIKDATTTASTVCVTELA